MKELPSKKLRELRAGSIPRLKVKPDTSNSKAVFKAKEWLGGKSRALKRVSHASRKTPNMERDMGNCIRKQSRPRQMTGQGELASSTPPQKANKTKRHARKRE